MKIDLISGSRVLTVDDYNRLARAINSNEIISSNELEIHRSPGGVGIHKRKERIGPSASAVILGIIDSSVGIASTNYAGEDLYNLGYYPPGTVEELTYLRWSYTWNLVKSLEVDSESGQYKAVESLVEEERDLEAHNIIELQNGYPAFGNGLFDAPEWIQGNGVEYKNLKNSFPQFKIQPAPVGVVVRMFKFANLDTGSPEWWFEYVNGVDGSCEE